MAKVKLEIEKLEVESFDTAASADERRGTVVGAAFEPRPVSSPIRCFETEITGPCCDYTLALSCVVDNCHVLVP